MVTKIRKRDGSVVFFQKDKIADAIWRAARAVGGKDREKSKVLADLVVEKLEEIHGENIIPDVEEVQDLVEKILIEEGHAKVAKAFILYRKSHDELRNVKGLFDTIEAVEDYIGLDDWMIKENSNMGFSLQGLNNYIATKIIANYWMRRIYPEAIRKVHEAGDLHIHDLGCLGAYCFDDKTKILTEYGWKFFKDVVRGEKVATKNLETGEMEFQVPYDRQVYDYSGEMYCFEGRGISLSVTPEHRLLVRRKHKRIWEFVNPTEFKYGMEFEKRVLWKGKATKMFQVPNVKGGNRKKDIGEFRTEDYVEFMGWYLSEGSVYEPNKGDYRISIAQLRKNYREEILKLLDKMKLNYNNQSKFNVHLHSKDLFYYLKSFGTSEAKYVPKNIKELDSKMIKRFLNALFKGDGSFSANGKLYKYYTKSPRLAEDVVECLLKVGICGTITKRKGMNIYMVSVENNHLTPVYNKKAVRTKYRGKVYDFSVQNGTLVVMRDGKVVVSGNCVGWDLKDLLTVGFKGVKGKVESKPPKHFRTALGQIVNFFYTLQGETAGAQAFSNFDTLLAPFVRYDNLNYKDVKQGMQEFLFNMTVPTRVGFQCMSEDTEILTPNGWAGYSDLKKGDVIKTFNIKKGVIENKSIKKLFTRTYSGVMYNLKNRIQDQLISPGHRIVRKKFYGDYILEEVENVEKMKSPFIIPISGINSKKDSRTNDDEIKLLAWIISEGTIENYATHRHCKRITVYQSKLKNSEKYDRIVSLLKKFKLNFSERDSSPALGDSVKMIRLDAKSSRVIHKMIGSDTDVNFIPRKLTEMSKKQSRLFLETYIKGDGFEECKIATTNKNILDGLQQISVNAEYGFTTLTRNPTIGKKLIYVLRLIKHKDTYIQEIKKVNYKGIIWCPNTDNETVIARRNGKVFVTGNTPFTNLTMDLKVPSYMADEHVLVGGQPQMETYKEFKVEMEMINRAFAECMLDGDASGRVFTFPIPTYNITKDFDWDNPDYNLIWEMTAKYGIPYFSNFVNSDMKPEDARSMCPLAGDEKVLIRSSRGRGFEYGGIGQIYRSQRNGEYEIYSDGKFVKGKFNKFSNQKMIKVVLENNHEIKMSESHLNYVISNKKEQIFRGAELEKGMYLPYSLTKYNGEGGNNDLGYFVGAYAGDGSYDGDTSVVFSLEGEYKKEIIVKLMRIAKHYFGANVVVTASKKSKLVTLKVHSKAAVGLCRDFVEGIQREKCYKARLFGSSLEFREGVLEGHYATDGGNRNRIYTSSKKMVQTLNMFAATLGTVTSIYEDKRDGRFGTEPNYAVLIYKLNREKYGDIWFKDKSKLWMKIKEVKKINGNIAYCFEVEKGKRLFTVGTTGILTHNCRLRLDQKELRKRGGGLFGANPQTGCYDEETEVLTENGWKFFRDVDKKEKVFTLNRENKIELYKPKKYFVYDYNGEMLRFNNRTIDLMVTPNHRMVVDQVASGKRKFVEAKDFDVNNQRIPKHGNWESDEIRWFILPGIEFTKYGRQGRTAYQVTRESLKIKMNNWLEFFGFWIAEGCTDNEKIAKRHGYRVVITQVKKKTRDEFRKILDTLPFNYYEEKSNFVICNKQLWTYLRKFGNKYEKFVPKEIKNLDKKQLKILFNWLVKGDGHVRKTNGQINYWTASKKLADDMQEIIMKIGWTSTSIPKKSKFSEIKGRQVRGGINYTIGVQRSRHNRLRKNNIKGTNYDGKVYCCEVENNTLFVRRNGRTCWCGNSIGVVTINMARLGYVSTDEDSFMGRLDRLMELAKESLEIKRKTIENFTEVGLYPYSKFYLRQVHQRFGEYWKNHFATIGLLGMNESIMNFMPNENITTVEGHKFAIKVMDFMRDRLAEYQEETGNIYNLEATPGEGTTYRFARMDKKRFGRIIVANEEAYKKGAKPYYTNSSQLPVNFTDDVFEALDLQDELQCKYTGGCIEKGNGVLTNRGLMKIEEIVKNFKKMKSLKVISYNNIKGISEWDEVIDAMKIDVRKHDKIRIKGEKNLDIVTSDWHPFFVLEKIKVKSVCPICKKKVEGVKSFANHLRRNEFCREKYKNSEKYRVVEKRADELEKGDYVLQNSFNLYPNKKTKLDFDLMWLVGFFIGDGCISQFRDNRGGNNIEKHSVRFFSSNKNVLERVGKILFEKFGAEVKVIKNDKRSSVLREIGTSKKEVLNFLLKLGFVSGKKVYDVRVPDSVKNNLNSSNIFSFLSGLMDSDGHISRRNGDLEYSTVSPNLADDLLEVFSVAGINIGKYSKESKRANEKKTYRLRIPQYYLSFIQDKIDANINVLNIREKVSNRKKRHLPIVRVKECSKINVEDNMFYDLTTKKNHNYLAGKDCLVFVHNTVFHTFIGEKLNKEAVKTMVKKISHGYHLPYFTITPTFSVCPVHGYLAGEHEYCPKCDEEIAEAENNPVSDEFVENNIEVGKISEVPSVDDIPLAIPLEVGDNPAPIELEKPLLNSQINLGGDIYGTDKV